MEQLETMESIEREINKVIHDPSEIDFERYNYYIEKGTDISMIAPLPDNQFEMFYRFLPQKLKNTPVMKEILDDLSSDVINDYSFSMRKAIVDYVLMNLEERKRLKIDWVPKPFMLK